MVDDLLYSKKQGVQAPLDVLLSENELPKFVKLYLETCKVEGKSPKTLERYGQNLLSFLVFSQANNFPQEAAELSAHDMRLFLLSHQERGVAPETVHQYYRVLNTFFNWLENEELIEVSPMRKVRPPKVPKKIMRPFTRQQIDDLLLLCSGNRFVEIRNRAIILLFLDTGLRLFELASIQRDDIDFIHGTIRVMGKGGKERVVRFGETTKKALWRYKMRRELKEKEIYPCWWASEEMTPLSKSAIQTVIHRLCQRSHISGPKLGPHTLRHTFATWAMLNGARREEVQLLLGHSSATMTERYQATVDSLFAIEGHKGNEERRGFGPVDRMGV